MIVKNNCRGFQVLKHRKYADDENTETRLAQHSSAIGDYEHSMEQPGSSFLWIGEDHHLNKEEVAEFIVYLQNWIETGKLYGG